MKRIAVLLLAVALSSCDRSDAATSTSKTPASETISDLNMLEFGNFEYVERMKLPDKISQWNGRMISAVGYMNPGRQVRDVKEFELVMNRESCCFGTRPKMNHFFQVTLKEGSTVYTSDPVTVVGRFVIDEQWDGDWQLGLYWLREARIVK